MTSVHRLELRCDSCSQAGTATGAAGVAGGRRTVGGGGTTLLPSPPLRFLLEEPEHRRPNRPITQVSEKKTREVLHTGQLLCQVAFSGFLGLY